MDSDVASPPEIISDTNSCLERNGDFDNANDSVDDWKADNESDILHDNGIHNQETVEQRGVSAAPNDPRLIQPTRRSKTKAEQVLMTVFTMDTWSNMGNRK